MSNASKKNAAQNNLKVTRRPANEQEAIDLSLDKEINAALAAAPIAKKVVKTAAPVAKVAIPAAAPKPEKVARVKKEKVVKVKSVTTSKGFAHLTPDLITQTLTALAAHEKRADIATRLNLNPGTVSDIASGAPYIRKQCEAAGMTHPKGAYVKYERPAASEKEARMTARKEGAAARQAELASKKAAAAAKREAAALAKAAASVIEVKPAAPVAAPAKNVRKASPVKVSKASREEAVARGVGISAQTLAS